MGFLDVFSRMLGSKQSGKIAGEFNGQMVTATAFMGESDTIDGFNAERLWETQPHLRTVVDFIARQMSQLSLKLYERDDEEVRRVREGTVADLLRKANDDETFSELLYALVGEWALHNDSYLLLLPNKQMRVVPSSWVTPKMKNAFSVESYIVSLDGKAATFDRDMVVRFKGWTPGNPTKGTSPVATLRLMLEEQHDARVYRKQIWRRSGRFGGFLTRPKDAPTWDNPARQRFDKMWHAFTGNSGARAGDTPLLEDGMEYKRVGFAAKEDQWLESVKASLEMCAQVYYINPTMVGMLDNANFSNVREFRRSLYGDSLGPIIKKIEDRFNAFVLPALGAPKTQFVEFNVEAKLRGSFEEQSAVVSTATGAPWQTRNEARKLFNLTPIEGGDELITPLNVLIGGQASPQDGITAADGSKAADAVRTFIVRQSAAVCAKRDGGVARWWDQARWDRELTSDLIKAGVFEHVAIPLAKDINTRALAHYAAGRRADADEIATTLEVTS